ncbi:MAG: hypothetical protein H0W13_09125 [Nitrospirales bacterium]|nr:hypothetical protein [Nitrospirales bacterium]MBA3754666.1 hypothetical protein [Nitrospira sp.]
MLQGGVDDWPGRTDDELWPPEMAEQFRLNDQQVFRSNATPRGR